MSNRRTRRARQHGAQKGFADTLAALMVLGAIGQAATNGATAPTIDAATAHNEGVRLAARLFLAATDEQRDDRILEAIERAGSDNAVAPVLAHALRQLAGGYVAPIVAGLAALDPDRAIELDVRVQAVGIIEEIDRREEPA